MSSDLGDIRNLLILLEILVTLLIPSVMTNNIGVANISSTSSSFSTAQNIVLAFVAITVIMLIIQLVIIFVGINQGNVKNIAYRNLIYNIEIVFHFVGCLLFGYYIIAPLHYTTIWYIWAIFVLIPFVWELAITGIKGTNINKYLKVIQN